MPRLQLVKVLSLLLAATQAGTPQVEIPLQVLVYWLHQAAL